MDFKEKAKRFVKSFKKDCDASIVKDVAEDLGLIKSIFILSDRIKDENLKDKFKKFQDEVNDLIEIDEFIEGYHNSK